MLNETVANPFTLVELQKGMLDVVDGNNLIRHVAAETVLVSAQADLAKLPAYPAGTIAHTAGFKAMWQLSAAGSWVSIL